MKNIFQTRLCDLIAESGKTQNAICAELNIRKQKLSNWKTGYTEPCLDDLVMLALYFDVSADFLLGLADDVDGRR